MGNAPQDQVAEQIVSAFRRLVKKRFRDSVTMNARLQADLDMDSLNVLTAVLQIERELGLSVPWDSPPASEILTVGDVVKFVTNRGGATGQ